MAEDNPKAEDMDAIDVGEDMDEPSPPLRTLPPLPVRPPAPPRASAEWNTDEEEEEEDGRAAGDPLQLIANPMLRRASGCCECGCDPCCC